MIDWAPSIDGWIVVVGALSAAACALLGPFLVLRRMSMMGDAISHAVLPGLALGFLLTGSRSSVVMFVGAALMGVLAAGLTQLVHAAGRVSRGAAMGVVFTTMFAAGLVLIVQGADKVDLDPGCVLYGAIELTPMVLETVFGVSVPRAALVLGVVLLVDLAVVLLFYKELKITSFDPELATSLGIDARVMHYLLMFLVAMTTVASFEAIGSILVIAMLVVPAATAHLLTDRLAPMIGLSVGLAVLAAGGGHVAAITVPTWFGFVDTSTAGMIAVVSGAIFAVTMLAAPRYGLVGRGVQRFTLSSRIAREDILGLLYRAEEAPDLALSLRPEAVVRLLGRTSGLRPFVGRIAMRTLLRRGDVARAAAGLRLTDNGRREASRLVRAHRLWETFLFEQLPLAADHLHDAAERLEHVTDPELGARLAAATRRPAFDPHGKRVPDQ